jgi:hypothetical protein
MVNALQRNKVFFEQNEIMSNQKSDRSNQKSDRKSTVTGLSAVSEARSERANGCCMW